MNHYCNSKWVAGDLTPSCDYGGASRAPINYIFVVARKSTVASKRAHPIRVVWEICG